MSRRAWTGYAVGALRRVFGRSVAPHTDASARETLGLWRVLVAVAVARVVLEMPSGRALEQMNPLLAVRTQNAPRRRPWPARRYEFVRAVAVSSVVLWGLGVNHVVVRAIANLSFAALERQVVDLDESAWNFHSHLHAFLAILSLDGSSGRSGGATTSDGSERVLLGCLQAVHAGVYLQSGVSKLIASGPGWARGATLRASWSELGTPLGKRLAHRRWLAAAASTGALALELAFVPLVAAGPRSRRLAGVAALAFHGTTKATMNISFWHLAWFSLPLIAGVPRREQAQNA